MKYFKNSEVKKALRERNIHIINNWLHLNFKCGPQATVTYDNYFPITLQGRYVGVECNCGKTFYEE